MIAERAGVVSESHDWLAPVAGRHRPQQTPGEQWRHDALSCGADDFGKCAFWYIDALLELFNCVLARRNRASLLSGDIDGPQTYSQVGLILSAMRLSRSWEEGLWHAS
jgi:hypothetical protein